ncbi:MAG: hypothetical protein PHW52_02820 [Candidatus Pacebacteria bacterium]|nr:hypothetical protein [Candidatus Paceibacterota bacterium]
MGKVDVNQISKAVMIHKTNNPETSLPKDVLLMLQHHLVLLDGWRYLGLVIAS